jgi:hypothetical protein
MRNKKIIAIVCALMFLLSMPSFASAETGLTGYDAVYQENLKIYQEQCSDEYMMEYLLAEPDNVYAYIINDEIRQVCKEITQNCTTDMEKLQAIHDWICTNLYYDTYGEAHGTTGVGAIYTFYNRGTRCEGFADLTASMCREVGIPCKEMEGYALKNVSVEGKTVEQLREELASYDATGNVCAHAWNEAWIDGRWVLMDNTWDCQNKNTSTNATVTYKKCTQTYFDMDLKEFSKSYLIDTNISYFESLFPKWKAKNYPTVTATEVPATTVVSTEEPDVTVRPSATVKPSATASAGGNGTTTIAKKKLPGKISGLSGVSQKKKVVLKWQKDTAAASYQIQYAVKKSFSGAKSKKINGTKCTISGLKKGKTYYFRVRGYGTGAGYGKWSSALKVKIK